MLIRQLYETLVQLRGLHGQHLPIGIQVNEDEVYLLSEVKVVFRTEADSATRHAHLVILKPEIFRQPTGKPPCIHATEVADYPDEPSLMYYKSEFCPDCGAKLEPMKGAQTND